MDAEKPANLPVATHSLGSRLRQDRLEHRLWRLERVVEALRARAREHRLGSPVPAALSSSLADFEREMAQVRAELDEYARSPGQIAQD